MKSLVNGSAVHQIVHDNLCLALQFFGRASGRGTVEERAGLLLIDSGVDYAVFNIAVLAEPIENLAQLELRIGLASEWYAKRRTRWSLWLCDDLIAPAVKPHLSGLSSRYRLHALTHAPGMVAETLTPLSRYLPPMEYKLVSDTQTRIDFAHLTTLNFDIPFATSRAIYEPEQAWQHDYVGYVGYVNRRPICTAALVVSDEAIGFYSIGTLAEFRRKGYAEALMRQLLLDARKVSGVQRTVLQSTRAGHNMYRKMGYRDVAGFSVFLR